MYVAKANELLSLPYAAITNYHKLTGLNNANFKIFSFQRSQVPDESSMAKIKRLAGLLLFLRLQGRIFAMPLPRGSCHFLICGCFTAISPCHHIAFCF